MASKILYLSSTDLAVGFIDSLTENTPSAATFGTGWKVAKYASGYWSSYVPNSTTGTAFSNAAEPTAATGRYFRSSGFLGKFASGNWVFTFQVRNDASYFAQKGYVKARLWKGTDPNGNSGLTQIGSGWTASALISFTAVSQVQAGTITIPVGTQIVFTNEYLFLEMIWAANTSGGNNNASVFFALDNSTKYLTTPDFVANAPPAMSPNTVTGSSFSSNPVLEFTGLDNDSDDIVYQLDVATDNSFTQIVHSGITGFAAGYTNTVNGADTSPYTSGQKIRYAPATSYSGVIINNDRARGGTLGDLNSTINADYYIAQAFTPGDDFTITSFGISLRRIGTPPGNVVITLQSDNGGLPSGTILATCTVAATSFPNNVDYPVVTGLTFSTQPTVLKGVTYHLVVFYNQGDINNDIEYTLTADLPVLGSFHHYFGAVQSWSLDTTVSLRLTITGTQAKTYTSGTYYWRVRGFDPAGTKTWGAWGETRNFTVSVITTQTATLATTEAKDTASVSGRTKVTGTLAATEAKDTAALTQYKDAFNGNDYDLISFDWSEVEITSRDYLVIMGNRLVLNSIVNGSVYHKSDSDISQVIIKGTAPGVALVKKGVAVRASAGVLGYALTPTERVGDYYTKFGIHKCWGPYQYSYTWETTLATPVSALVDHVIRIEARNSGTTTVILKAFIDGVQIGNESYDTNSIIALTGHPAVFALGAGGSVDTYTSSALDNWSDFLDYGPFPVSAAISATESGDTASMAGTVSEGPVTGTLSVTEAKDTASVSGSTKLTGSLSVTEAKDTASVNGKAEARGTLAVTEAKDTVSASGTNTKQTVTGSLSVTEAKDVASVSGKTETRGSLTVTEAKDPASVSGKTETRGSLTVTEVKDTASVNGKVEARGSLTVTEAKDTASVSGKTETRGSLSITEAQDTASVSGTNSKQAVTGSLAVTEAKDTASVSGSTKLTGSLSVTEAKDTSSVSGKVESKGTLAVTEAKDAVSVSGKAEDRGSLAITEAKDSASASGKTKVTGTLSASEAKDIAIFSADGITRINGSLNTTESPDTASVTGQTKVRGSLSPVDPKDVPALSGSVSDRGSIASTEAKDTASFSGKAKVTGTLTASESPDKASFAADSQNIITGQLSATESQADTCNATGSVKVGGSIQSSEGSDAASASGTVAVLGSVATSETGDLYQLNATVYVYGSLAITELVDRVWIIQIGDSSISDFIGAPVEVFRIQEVDTEFKGHLVEIQKGSDADTEFKGQPVEAFKRLSHGN